MWFEIVDKPNKHLSAMETRRAHTTRFGKQTTACFTVSREFIFLREIFERLITVRKVLKHFREAVEVALARVGQSAQLDALTVDKARQCSLADEMLDFDLRNPTNRPFTAEGSITVYRNNAEPFGACDKILVTKRAVLQKVGGNGRLDCFIGVRTLAKNRKNVAG